MGIGLGVGINRSNYAQGIFGAYATRVVADGGVVEAGACVDAVSGLLLSASLLLIPSGYKGGKLYAEIPTNGNGDLTWTRSGTANRTNASGNIELMGANVPRLSYMYGSCPAVLAEPQRTNLCLYSEQFNDASWLKNNTTVTANQETSPDGTQNADLLSASSGATAFLYRSFTLTAGTSYTFSIYVKKKTVTISSNRFRINFVNNLFVDFSGSVPVITSGSGSIQNSANGFYRIITTVTPSVASNVLYLYPDGNNNSADEFYIYGAQLEAGAYPSTYISTTSASATRVADSFSRNNIYTNGLITSSGGTWFVELRGNVAYTRDNASSNLILFDSVGNNYLRFRNDGTPNSRLRIQKVISGTSTDLIITPSNTCKVAIKWDGSTADVFINGVKEISATSFTATQLQDLTATVQVPTFIQQMALFPEPKSDQFCIDLTTL